MIAFDSPVNPTGNTVTVTATAAKLFSSNSNGRRGYRFMNWGAEAVYVLELRAGSSAPTAADIVTNKFCNFPPVQAESSFESAAGKLTDVWVVTASGTATVWPEELF